MTSTELSALLKGLVPGVREFVSALLKTRDARQDALEARITALEARKSVTYRGVFTDGKRYEPGDMVTSDGSVWHCNVETQMRPGAGAMWTLAVKHGRDAR